MIISGKYFLKLKQFFFTSFQNLKKCINLKKQIYKNEKYSKVKTFRLHCKEKQEH